jgi:hypothetical protein
MRIEEAIVWLLSTEGRGMTAETLAEEINLRRLHRRRDGQPVGTDAALGGYCHHFDSFWPGVEYMVDRAYEKGRRRQSF